MAAGILATLTHIVEEERSAPDLSQCTDLQDLSDDSTDKKNSYVCTLCDHDITNTYYQCLGCSNLDQDYIVCLPCFKEKRHLKDQAKICKHLVGSSRHVFKKHFRLYTPDFLKDVLACVAELADGNAVGFGHETYCRLQRRVLVQGPEEAEHPGYGNYGSYGELLFPTALTTTTVNDTGAAEAGAESSQTSSRRRTNGDGHLVSVQQLADPAAARPVPILAAPAAVSRGQGGEVEEEEDDNIGQRKYIKEFPFPISKGECVLWNLTVPAKKKGIRSNQYYYTPPNSEGKGKKIRSLNALQLFVCKETPNTFELLGHTFRFEEARQGTGAVLIPPFVYQGDAVDCPEKFVEFIDPLWQWALDNGWNPKENQTA
jgi:hypothetical protein